MLSTIGINLSGDLLAQVNLGLIAEIGYAHTLKKELWSQPIPSAGIKIGSFLTVGVAVTVSAEAEFAISASGEVVAGVSAHYDDFNVHINLINPLDNRMSGFSPVFDHTFEAAGQISATLGLGLPIEIGVGVNIPPLQFNKQIGLVNTPKVEAKLQFTSPGAEEEDQCGANGGLGWSVTASDEISLDLVGHEIELGTIAEKELAGGCIAANAGSPVVTVPVKAIPTSLPPAFPRSTCPDYVSTGRIPWAVYDNLDVNGEALTLTSAPDRNSCNAQCEANPRKFSQATRSVMTSPLNQSSNCITLTARLYF
jgi:hypothetical protein